MLLLYLFAALALIGDILTYVFYCMPAGRLWVVLHIYIVWFIGIVLVYVILLFIFSCFLRKQEEVSSQPRIVRKLLEETLKFLLVMCRVHVHTEGADLLPKERFVLVGNHISDFDPIVCLTAFCGYDISFIAKPEIFRVPLVGGIMHMCCFLPIDRESPRNALKTINRAAELMKQDVVSIGIYPEGTRSKTGELLEFHPGAFQTAKRGKTPIAVVAVKNTELVAKHAPFKRTDVYLKVVGVIDKEQVASMQTREIGQQVREMLIKAL